MRLLLVCLCVFSIVSYARGSKRAGIYDVEVFDEVDESDLDFDNNIWHIVNGDGGYNVKHTHYDILDLPQSSSDEIIKQTCKQRKVWWKEWCDVRHVYPAFYKRGLEIISEACSVLSKPSSKSVYDSNLSFSDQSFSVSPLLYSRRLFGGKMGAAALGAVGAVMGTLVWLLRRRPQANTRTDRARMKEQRLKKFGH
eukprot:TRINITY_DN5467_c0_g1_i1.p1 TRINITY_DN5467_c0_g1~~TRINITY_DN5467_c0_g1_i1.p1  ORF type:complete len:196 (+),score=26.10 TRINITY_DN5467_c0_g1_i1:62-649(+)